MRKRLLSCLLLLALLGACAPAQPQSSPAQNPAADAVAQAVLAACGGEDTGVQPLHTQLEGDGRLADYLADFYALEEGSWDDCALYLSADPAQAFEVSVFRLSPQADPQGVADGLEEYRLGRQASFTGYAPEQADLAARGRVALSPDGHYAALLICPDPEGVQAAFTAALTQSPTAPSPTARPVSSATPAPTPFSSPTPEPTPAPTPTPTSTPAPTPTPNPHPERTPYTDPQKDDMSLYDTSAIRAAWAAGDPGALGQEDLAIYQRAQQVLSQIIQPGMDDYAKEQAVYAWVTANVSYDNRYHSLYQTVPRASFTPYNPLVEGLGVCLGFATTFQLLMDLSGVECITVVGASAHSQVDHAWNMVRLDGAWYCVDATWDEGRSPGSWNYFNVTSDYMAATDHQWDYARIPEAVG